MIVAGHVRRDAGRRPALPGQAYRLRMVGGGERRSLGNTTKNGEPDAGRRPVLPEQAHRLRMVGGGEQRSLGNTTKNGEPDAGRRLALAGQAYRLRMVGGGEQRSLGNTTKNGEPDQKRFIRHVPRPDGYCVRGFGRSFSQPHVPPSATREGEKGGAEEGEESPGLLCSPGSETVKTLFHRVAETHALPASVPLNTLLRTIVEPHQKARFLITL